MVTEPTATAGEEDGVLREDIPCHRCGYNLRGLTPPGDCPECGWDLRDSIHEHRRRGKLIAPPDPVWARQIREGGWLAIAAAAAVLALLVVPRAWFYMPFRDAPLYRTPGRVLLLGLSCISWVFAWASIWKLTALEGREGERVLAARCARFLCTIYLLVPFAWAAATWTRRYPSGEARDTLRLLLVCGAAGIALLMMRIAQLMNRRRALLAAVEAFVLALAVPATAWWLSSLPWSGVERDPSSLGFMLRIWLFPVGVPEINWEVWRELLRGRIDHPAVWLLALLPVWTISLAARLIRLYRPARSG